LLFYLAPLPLMVAALAWGPLCASIGGIAAAISLGAIFSLPYCLAFALTVALPAWWLGHLALLGRPLPSAVSSGNGAEPPKLEWYPVGRVLLWIAGFATLTTMAALLTLGTDAAEITGALRRFLLRILGPADAAPSGEIDQWIDWLVMVAPAGAAVVAIMTLTLNLWLSAKITATSGRLHRPWPDLKSAALPPMTAYYLMKCGSTALVPYYRPGDPAVTDAIKGLAGKYASVLLANHGPVVSGETLEAAVFAIEELEETAKLYLLLRGLNPRYLTPAQVKDLSKTFGLTLPEHGH